MTLFRNQSFISHSGRPLTHKVECDDLTDEDIETFALRVASHFAFSELVPIPNGGTRLVAALEKYRSPVGVKLIVDDVFTTGGSMEAMRLQPGNENAIGVVVFARAPTPAWIYWWWLQSEWAGP